MVFSPTVPAAETTPAAIIDDQKEQIRAELLVPEGIPPSGESALEEILASPDFGGVKPGWKIRFKKDISEGELGEFHDSPRLREILGIVLRAAAVLALAAALGTAFFLALRNRGFSFTDKSRTAVRAKTGRDRLPREPLLLLERAISLYREGKIREGWSHCLRAFIAVLGQKHSFPDEATEYETLALARRIGGIQTEGFEMFIKRWISLAYGGMDPGKESFEASLKDCRALIEEEEALLPQNSGGAL